MVHLRAVYLAALILTIFSTPAVCDSTRTVSAFVEIPLQEAPRRSHLLAYASMATGAGLIAWSFVLGDRANDTYEDYLAASEPGAITELYDETVRLDRWSSATLITGEVLVVTGLYLRFLRRGGGDRMAVAIGPRRCALSYRF